ncbi:MAG: MarR family transcriptional regulator [Candidatus Lustribacter sp.]|jgi:DNA-binding MarR family transcriptional regulator
MTSRHSASAKAITQLILTVFRLNSELVLAGDRLTKDLRLTSARWQIFGQLGSDALTASQIARNMSLNRQNVQPLVDALERDGLVEFVPNPNHRRAKLIRMTSAGRRAYHEALARQVDWSNRFADGLPAKDLVRANEVLRELVGRLQADD